MSPPKGENWVWTVSQRLGASRERGGAPPAQANGGRPWESPFPSHLEPPPPLPPTHPPTSAANPSGPRNMWLSVPPQPPATLPAAPPPFPPSLPSLLPFSSRPPLAQSRPPPRAAAQLRRQWAIKEGEGAEEEEDGARQGWSGAVWRSLGARLASLAAEGSQAGRRARRRSEGRGRRGVAATGAGSRRRRRRCSCRRLLPSFPPPLPGRVSKVARVSVSARSQRVPLRSLLCAPPAAAAGGGRQGHQRRWAGEGEQGRRAGHRPADRRQEEARKATPGGN